MLDNYEINRSTLMILSDSKNSKIIELEDEFKSNVLPTKIIEKNCKMYGSSLEGRKTGTEALIGIKYKAPIIISEINKLIFFPTSSTRSEDCSWISLNNVEKYYKKNKSTVILFNNGLEYEINVSFYIIENQILKATLLESKLNKISLKK